MSQTKSAFTIIELAIAILLIAVLLSSSLKLLSISSDTASVVSARQDLKMISQALSSFYNNNSRLPCPATISTNFSDPNAGDENCSIATHANSGAILYGAIPINELNIAKKYMVDSWENKYSYYVRTNSTTGTMTGNTDIFIHDQNLARDDVAAIFVVISHGADGMGAFSSAGTQVPSDDATVNEVRNIHSNNSKTIDASNRLIISDGAMNDISIAYKRHDIGNDY